MPPTMTTQSVGRPAAASRGGGTGGQAGRGGGRTRGRFGNQGNGRNNGLGGQVGGQGSEVNGGVGGVLDFSTIIAQQLQNLLPTIVAQVGDQGRGQGAGDQGRGQGAGRNQNSDAVNDHIQGDVRNATEGNGLRGYTYKEFLACNPNEYDGKGGVVRFGKKEILAPRFVGPFDIIEKVGTVAYGLDSPKELNGVHDTFYVSNLKKCLADPKLQVPLDEIRVDNKLNFVEEPVEIMEREFK
nr:putative reverse transcriptase domain-containing protein [Tanacetum cinerariifolium]